MLAVVSAHTLITEVFLTFAAPAQKQMQPEACAPQDYERREGKGGGVGELLIANQPGVGEQLQGA